jgi:hypothetical protein
LLLANHPTELNKSTQSSTSILSSKDIYYLYIVLVFVSE